MASDKGVSSDALDERLASARDGLLGDGEKIVAQEEGDQGQAIVLTDSRVLVVKVGITATGTANGCVTGAFALSEVKAVNVRKGPLGAIIQVVADSAQISAQSGPPNNIVVFTGPQRVKRCESIAVKTEAALGKPVGRVESIKAEAPVVEQPAAEAPAPAQVVQSQPEPEAVATVQASPEVQEKPAAVPKQRKGGREPSSLADEIYAELTASKEPPPEQRTEPTPSTQAAPIPVAPAAEPSAKHKDVEMEPEPVPQFGPNPYLPKPVGRGRIGVVKALAGVGALMVLLLLGMAVTAPLRATHESHSPVVSVSRTGKNAAALRQQQDVVRQYQAKVSSTVAASVSALTGLESALRSSNKGATESAVRSDTSDALWRKLNSLEAPAGLVGAKENLVSGLFIAKTAFLNVASELQSNAGVSGKPTLARVAEAKAVLTKGAAAVEKMRVELEKRIAEVESQKKRQH